MSDSLLVTLTCFLFQQEESYRVVYEEKTLLKLNNAPSLKVDDLTCSKRR